jgi:ribosomal protein S12
LPQDPQSKCCNDLSNLSEDKSFVLEFEIVKNVPYVRYKIMSQQIGFKYELKVGRGRRQEIKGLKIF